LQVRVSSLDSLLAFYSFIKNEKNTTSNRVSARHIEGGYRNDRLTKKLFAKARAKVGVLAKASGKQIVSISTVAERRFLASGNYNVGFDNNLPLNAPIINIDGKQVSAGYRSKIPLLYISCGVRD
jgi:hypothetical protein